MATAESAQHPVKVACCVVMQLWQWGTSSLQPHLKMPFIETYLCSLGTQTHVGQGMWPILL